IEDLLKKKIDGTLTAEESLLLQEWAGRAPSNQFLFDNIADEGFIRQQLQDYHELATHDEETYPEKLFARVNRQLKPTRSAPSLFKWMAIASCVLLLAGVYFFSVREQK